MIKKIILFMAFFTYTCIASFNVYQFEDKRDESRFRTLITELRCPKCQNNNLADSNADLSTDIKNLIYKSIIDGKSDQEIRDYLISRYGEFVTYKPPFKGSNVIIWVAPILLFIISIIVILTNRRTKQETNEKIQSMDDIIREYKQQDK